MLFLQDCPPLRAYYTEQLDQQLNEGLHAFCNSGVKLLDDDSLVINSIFKWFSVDFGSTEASVLEYVYPDLAFTCVNLIQD